MDRPVKSERHIMFCYYFNNVYSITLYKYILIYYFLQFKYLIWNSYVKLKQENTIFGKYIYIDYYYILLLYTWKCTV